MSPAQQITRRRTLAIISHPDAGKTTLTEKFLLYGGAIHLAGSVKDRKAERATTSDWMEIEKQRGISISSTVLQFEYEGHAVNLLDTPGHKDFSEDTYRVLTAVDAALMVIDAAKGVEAQTQKLFEVCRRRGIPIFTLINKCDRPTRDPLELLDQLENVLGIQATAVNWPLGNGPTFRGVFDRLISQVHLFDRTAGGGAHKAPVKVASIHDDALRTQLDEQSLVTATEQLAMLDGAGHPFDLSAVHAGVQSPVYFGSAINNFGIELLLRGFLRNSVPPAPRHSVSRNPPGLPYPTLAQEISVQHEKFSGFVFKIQANMDPKHRDRIAFVRVCSGRFTRDMTVTHQRTGKTVRLSSSHKLFGQERETVDEAWPGDIIGLVGHSEFRIGDTLTEDRLIFYDEIPRFPSEVFAYLSSTSPAEAKKYRTGLTQLLQEGVVQSFHVRNTPSDTTLIAAVGTLQFEVVQHRLLTEYKADSRLATAPWTLLRWIEPHPRLNDLSSIVVASGVSFGHDTFEQPIVLFPNEWTLNYFIEKNPELRLHTLPLEQTANGVTHELAAAL